MLSSTLSVAQGGLMYIRVLLIWILFSFISSQNKGDRFQVLQTGESFQLVIGYWADTGPSPGHLMVGGWFKWNRCTYAATHSSASHHRLLEPGNQRNWLPVYLSIYNETEAECSTVGVGNTLPWSTNSIQTQAMPM